MLPDPDLSPVDPCGCVWAGNPADGYDWLPCDDCWTVDMAIAYADGDLH